jgi:predicted acetyltransferase
MNFGGADMSKLKLVLPSEELEIAALEFRAEHFYHGEMIIHGSALFDLTADYNDWLDMIRKNFNEKSCSPGWVPAETFFAVRKADGRIIGIIDIRHILNEFLAQYGGHIGYSVRPSERQKGYGTEMLKLALDHCGNLGLNKILLICHKDNKASAGTIVKCGGVLTEEYTYTDGKTAQKYWISLE